VDGLEAGSATGTEAGLKNFPAGKYFKTNPLKFNNFRNAQQARDIYVSLSKYYKAWMALFYP